jgi:hypothetical protein
LLLTEVNTFEVESVEINFTVAFDMGVLSETSFKIPLTNCACKVFEIKKIRKKENKNLYILIIVDHLTPLFNKSLWAKICNDFSASKSLVHPALETNKL